MDLRRWTISGAPIELPITAAVHGRPLIPEVPLKNVRPEIAEILLRCLSANPAERPTAAELLVAVRADAITSEHERVG
jgi:hypothetical protein